MSIDFKEFSTVKGMTLLSGRNNSVDSLSRVRLPADRVDIQSQLKVFNTGHR